MYYFFKTEAKNFETYAQAKQITAYHSDHYSNQNYVGDLFDIRDLYKTFKGMTFEGWNYYDFIGGSCCDDLMGFFSKYVLNFTSPKFDAKTKTVQYFESVDKRDKEVYTTSKIGKFIRKIAPFYNDKQVEILVDLIVEMHTIPNYEYKVARTAEEFGEVYRMRPASGSALGNYSCINASCMRDKYGENHPCQVYGSGDFELHYLVNESGKICARTILCTVDDDYAYIYAHSFIAGKTLEEKLKEAVPGAQKAEEDVRAWEGARLLKIECQDGLLAPYLDVCQNAEEHDDYFVISYDGDVEFNSTRGYVAQTKTCACCEDRYFSDSMSEIDGEHYCYDCTFHCDYTGERFVGEYIEVITQYGVQHWSESAVEEHAVYNEQLGQYYEKEYYAKVQENLEKYKDVIAEKKYEGYQVCDEVLVIGNTNSSINRIGDIGVITEIYNSYNACRVSVPGRGNLGNNTRLNEIVVIKRKENVITNEEGLF